MRGHIAGTLGSSTVTVDGTTHVMVWHPHRRPNTLCEIPVTYGLRPDAEPKPVDCLLCIPELR